MKSLIGVEHVYSKDMLADPLIKTYLFVCFKNMSPV